MKGIPIGTLLHADKALDYIPILAKHGFECFAITFGGSAEGYDLDAYAQKVYDIAGEHRVFISALGVYGNTLAGGRQDVLRSLEAVIGRAQAFGCDTVSCFAGRVPGESVERSLPEFKKVFGSLTKRAKDCGVKIALENCAMGDTWNAGSWNIATYPAAWELLFEQVPDETLGLEWEPAHQMRALIDPIPQLRKWVRRIHHIHGKDATVAWDVIRESGIHGNAPYCWDRTPGFGDSNWADILTILQLGGYTGTVDIEGYHDPVYKGDKEWTAQLYSLRYLKRCRGGEQELLLS